MAELTELIRRVHTLGNRVFYLGEYIFADVYGYTLTVIDKFGEDIEKDLNGAIKGLPDGYTIDEQKLVSIDLSLLEEWEERIKQAMDKIQSDEIYKQLFEAYNLNNQNEISKLITSVFSPKLLKNKIVLYHGVTPRKVTLGEAGIDFKVEKPPVSEYLTPDEYINLVLRIQEEGLLPSKGLHHDMDEYIRPVFTVDDHEHTYGLLFFEMNPLKHGYYVFYGGNVDGEEHLIYTPRLKIPMQLCLKSAGYVESDRMDGQVDSLECANLTSYRNQLEDRLKQRKINFDIVELS